MRGLCHHLDGVCVQVQARLLDYGTVCPKHAIGDHETCLEGRWGDVILSATIGPALTRPVSVGRRGFKPAWPPSQIPRASLCILIAQRALTIRPCAVREAARPGQI